MTSINISAAEAGTLVIGGDLAVHPLGFGSMSRMSSRVRPPSAPSTKAGEISVP